MENKGKLFVVSGPSGAGKGTICSTFLGRNKTMELSVSCTTRQPRQGEVPGESYHFVSHDFFTQMIENHELLEYVHVFGNYYGTSKKWVFDKLADGKDVLLEIEIKGALQVKEVFPEAVMVFVIPPNMHELKKRIMGRGTESKQEILDRLSRSLEEVMTMKYYNYYLINDNIELAVSNLEAIVRAEKHKITSDSIEIVETLKIQCEEMLRSER